MPRRRNLNGYCDERSIQTFEMNLCDYYNGKRKSNKPLCRNCTHFHIVELTIKKQEQEEPNKQE